MPSDAFLEMIEKPPETNTPKRRLKFRIRFECATVVGFLLLTASWAASKTFSYVDSRAVLTAEFPNAQRATVNLFNLTDYVVVFKAQDLLVLSDANVLSIGQVIAQEGKTVDSAPYAGSLLVRPWSFVGIEVVGVFPVPDNIQQVIVILGGKRLYLAKSSAAEFEELAGRIESLDMKKRNGAQLLQAASIMPRGRIEYPSGEQDTLDVTLRKILGAEDINPPRLLVKTAAQPTPEALKAGISGRVKLSISLSKYGEIKDVKVLKGLGYGLDERAVAVVKNSWKFLPATKNSDLVEVTLSVEVDFAPRRNSGQAPIFDR